MIKNNNEKYLKNKHILPYLSIIMRSESTYINRQLNNKYNFGKTQILILKKLSLTREPLNQEYFAKYYSINKGSIARTCQKLEDNNYIKRIIDPENKRQYTLHLTEKGNDIAQEIQELEEEWENKLYMEFDGTQSELLDKLRNIAEISIKMIK